MSEFVHALKWPEK